MNIEKSKETSLGGDAELRMLKQLEESHESEEVILVSDAESLSSVIEMEGHFGMEREGSSRRVSMLCLWLFCRPSYPPSHLLALPPTQLHGAMSPLLCEDPVGKSWQVLRALVEEEQEMCFGIFGFSLEESKSAQVCFPA